MMTKFTATICWQKGEQEKFTDRQFSRAHQWHFEGGISLEASSSPQVIPTPMSMENHVDPEQALVAAVSSCHMMTFLGIAAKRGFIVGSYQDKAVGVLEYDARGRGKIGQIFLNPVIEFLGEKVPLPNQLEKLHHTAHLNCFIANSVSAEIIIR